MEATKIPIRSAKTSGLAIASLVTGLTCIAPVAIVCGHVALSRIKKSAGQLGGFGLALAGTILGYFGLAALIFSIIPAIFIGAKAWKQGSDRAACIMQQRNIQTVVRGYQAEKGLQPGATIDVAVIMERLDNPSAVTCPAGGTITIHATVPETGELASECPHAEDLMHVMPDHSDW